LQHSQRLEVGGPQRKFLGECFAVRLVVFLQVAAILTAVVLVAVELIDRERREILGTQEVDVASGMPLRVITCDFKVERDTEILRPLPNLEKINGKDVKEFWKEVDKK
jgi:hypothetical protein